MVLDSQEFPSEINQAIFRGRGMGLLRVALERGLAPQNGSKRPGGTIALPGNSRGARNQKSIDLGIDLK
jgi:hypothetical protein